MEKLSFFYDSKQEFHTRKKLKKKTSARSKTLSQSRNFATNREAAPQLSNVKTNSSGSEILTTTPGNHQSYISKSTVTNVLVNPTNKNQANHEIPTSKRATSVQATSEQATSKQTRTYFYRIYHAHNSRSGNLCVCIKMVGKICAFSC